MKKIIFSLIAVLAALVPSTISAYEFEIDGIYYITNGNEATVTKSFQLDPQYYSGYVIIPESVTYGPQTFSVTAIGDSAFMYCENLTCVIIPYSVTTIGEDAFLGCSNLKNIDIPNSVTNIGEYAFSYSGLTSMTIPNSVTHISYYMFCGCNNLRMVYIPNSITSIGEGAFVDCFELRSIDIPNSVTYIGEFAFKGCEYPTNIYIPSSVTFIGQGAFAGVTNHWFNDPWPRNMSVDVDNPIYDSRDNSNAIIETSSNVLIAGCQNTIIPNTVTAIGSYAFEECEWLTSVTIPNSVTTIENSAFISCQRLKSVIIGNSVTYVGASAFAYCNCLTNVTCLATIPPSTGNVFYSHSWTTPNIYNKATLFVPAESIEAYRAHEEWGKFTHIVPFRGVGPGDINGDGNIAISDATNLIDQLLSGEELPAYADVNGDGVVTIKDVTDLIDMLLNGN